jgi:thiamine-phosphate pyrophosphorylase
MKVIVITPPEYIEKEANIIVQLLEHGVWAIHLRKPGTDASSLERLIQEIPQRLRSQLVLHDHFKLVKPYALKGVHLNRRNPIPPDDFNGSISQSFHSIEELKDMAHLDYAFLSPIFDSISKQGYHAAFSHEQLYDAHEQGLINERVYALGGVSIDRLKEVATIGFGGAAMLGDVWKHAAQPDFNDYLDKLRDLCTRLQ